MPEARWTSFVSTRADQAIARWPLFITRASGEVGRLPPPDSLAMSMMDVVGVRMVVREPLVAMCVGMTGHRDIGIPMPVIVMRIMIVRMEMLHDLMHVGMCVRLAHQ